MADSASSFFPANLRIPVDLFVSKKHPGLTPGDLGFADCLGNLVYFVRKSSSIQKSLFDASGNLLIVIHRQHKGMWEAFKGNGGSKKERILKIKRTLNKLTRTELEVYLIGENKGEAPDLKLRGCPFQKSCTTYSGDSIVAQTSLMYKLKQIYVGRSRFRMTIFPGTLDHSLIVALVAIFLEARK